MMWDFCEVYPGSDSTGGFASACDWIDAVLKREAGFYLPHGQAQTASATEHPLPTDAADCFITDPPYYDAVPYAYLSDFFYVWLRRNLFDVHSDLFKTEVVPKDSEIVVDRTHELSNSTHDIAYYERELAKAFGEGRRVVRPDGISGWVRNRICAALVILRQSRLCLGRIPSLAQIHCRSNQAGTDP
jgi:adenine-specific DNA methylase